MLEIKEISLTDLNPYENNPRLHSSQQIDQIAASISEFGFVNPVLVDKANMIIAGHGRYMAAKKLGLDSVLAIELPDLTNAQKKALVIADNKIAMNSSWDQEVLWDEIRNLNELGFDLDLIGFNEIEIMPMLDAGTVRDLAGEWDGMPEFAQEDLRPHRTVLVHFKTDEDVEEFAEMVGQRLTDKTKFIWHPEQEDRKHSQFEYAVEGDEA